MVADLRNRNLVGMIFAKTLNGLEESKLLCREPSPLSGMIPNFCLGFQPCRIPLIFAWIAFRFSTHHGTLYHLFHFFFFLLHLSFSRSLKENCVPLVGLRYCSYYYTCRIARQFGDHQGAPSDDGSFHTLEFIDTTLSRICKAWPQWRLTRGIRRP